MSKGYTYRLPTTDGVTVIRAGNELEQSHQIALRVTGSAIAGSFTLEAKPQGSDNFFPIEQAASLLLSEPVFINFDGAVLEYRVTLSGVSGVSGLVMTDTANVETVSSWYGGPAAAELANQAGLGQGINLDAWGKQKTAHDVSLYHGMFTFEVPQEYWKESLNGTELTTFNNATSVNGELNLTSNGVLNDEICLETFRNPRYQPNRGHLWAASLFFPNPTNRGQRTVGIFTKESGLGFRLVGDGTDWFLYGISRTLVATVATDTQTLLGSSQDLMSLPSQYDPEKGNIYDIQAQMRMVGNFNFWVGDETTGASKQVMKVKNLNKLDALSVFNPAMPLAFECINQGDDVVIRCGCVDLSTEGGNGSGGFYGSVSIDNQDGQVGISGFNVPILAVRNLTTVPVSLLRNTRDVIALLATAYADQKCIFRVWATRDQTAITLNDQTWVPFRDGLIEYVQYDNPDVTTPMTFDTSKAELIFGCRVGQDQNYATSALFEGRADIYQTPGDIFIFTMHRESGTAANVGVTYEFAEEV